MGQFCIERPLGVGGMADVYQASWLLPPSQRVPVALKLLRRELASRDTRDTRDAFASREALVGLRLTHNHPNLVSVFDFFEDLDERLFLVMELVEGGTLADVVQASAAAPHDVVRHVAREVLGALAYLHAHDVLHRDLSPSNVLVSTRGYIKVSDLGLAKSMRDGVAHTQTFRGKPAYASREALQCLGLDARSDLYSLGATLYELLAGAPPFGESSALPLLRARMENDAIAPLPASVPSDLATLCAGLLRPDPETRRPQSASEALALLQPCEAPDDSVRFLADFAREAHRYRQHEPPMASLPAGVVLSPRRMFVGRASSDAAFDAAAKARTLRDECAPPLPETSEESGRSAAKPARRRRETMPRRWPIGMTPQPRSLWPLISLGLASFALGLIVRGWLTLPPSLDESGMPPASAARAMPPEPGDDGASSKEAARAAALAPGDDDSSAEHAPFRPAAFAPAAGIAEPQEQAAETAASVEGVPSAESARPRRVRGDVEERSRPRREAPRSRHIVPDAKVPH